MQTEVATTGQVQMDDIKKTAKELIEEGHSERDQIHKNQRLINQKWSELQLFMKREGDDLSKAARLTDFYENCADTRSWMDEKFVILMKKYDASDIKAIQVLFYN